jgi:hypothetical protein
VDPETARRYREATPELRHKYDLLIRLQLHEFIARPRPGVQAARDTLSAEAEANGLTDELLADILRGCHDERRA